MSGRTWGHIKRFSVVPVVFAAGCASSDHYNAVREQTQAWREVEVAKANADARKYDALMAAARDADPATRLAIALTLGGAGGNGLQSARTPLPQVTDPHDMAYKWAALIVPGATNIASAWFGYSLGKTQSDNAAITAISSNQTMLGLGVAGTSAVQNVATSGFNAFASLPPSSSTVNTYTTTVGNGSQAVFGGSTLTDSRRNCVPTYNQSPGGLPSPLPAGSTFTNDFNPTQPFTC